MFLSEPQRNYFLRRHVSRVCFRMATTVSNARKQIKIQQPKPSFGLGFGLYLYQNTELSRSSFPVSQRNKQRTIQRLGRGYRRNVTMDANIKITTVNIHSCIGTDNIYSATRVAKVIQKECPDNVCLQEVEVNNIAIKTRTWSQYHGDDQAALIANIVGMKYHAFVPAIRSRAESKWKERHEEVSPCDISGRFDAPPPQFNRVYLANNNIKTISNKTATRKHTGKFGIAILSKYPILQIKTHYYCRYKNKTQRNVMACLVKLPKSNVVWVVNTHLGCHFIGKEQAKQAEELAFFINSLEKSSEICGVITCGDFNSPPWYFCIKELQRHGLRDVWEKFRSLDGTFPSHERVIGIPKYCGSCFRKILRLDYIFLTGHFQCKLVYVDDCYEASFASDHLPLCAVVSIDHSQQK